LNCAGMTTTTDDVAVDDEVLNNCFSAVFRSPPRLDDEDDDIAAAADRPSADQLFVDQPCWRNQGQPDRTVTLEKTE